MKVRYEGGDILVDFNSRGWNPQTLKTGVTQDYFEEFLYKCDLIGLEVITLAGVIEIVEDLALENIKIVR
jgi:hypothetical protein